MTIADNIAVREAREGAFGFVVEYLKEQLGGSPELLARAWIELGDSIDAVTQIKVHQPNCQTANAMDDGEAKRFERKKMKFGKHQGEEVKDVPLSYLTWLDEDEFRSDLNRYLKRPDVWREQFG